MIDRRPCSRSRDWSPRHLELSDPEGFEDTGNAPEACEGQRCCADPAQPTSEGNPVAYAWVRLADEHADAEDGAAHDERRLSQSGGRRVRGSGSRISAKRAFRSGGSAAAGAGLKRGVGLGAVGCRAGAAGVAVAPASPLPPVRADPRAQAVSLRIRCRCSASPPATPAREPTHLEPGPARAAAPPLRLPETSTLLNPTTWSRDSCSISAGLLDDERPRVLLGLWCCTGGRDGTRRSAKNVPDLSPARSTRRVTYARTSA